jgi:hypothetical protein
MIDYFPLYERNTNSERTCKPYYPPSAFFWKIFASLHQKYAREVIDKERDKRYFKEEAKNKTIMVDTKILEALQNVKYYSKKKGRALFNMKP